MLDYASSLLRVNVGQFRIKDYRWGKISGVWAPHTSMISRFTPHTLYMKTVETLGPKYSIVIQHKI